MSEIINVPMKAQRDIQTVTAEIRVLQRQTQRLVLEYAIDAGRLLTEAKSMVPAGDWGRYIREELDYSQSTVNNLMQIYREYGADQIGILGAEAASQTLGKLSYTKALRLLAIPAEEREEFAEEHDAEHLSTRELEQAIREAKEEKQRAQRLQEEKDRLEQQCRAAEAARKQAEESAEQAEADAKAAKELKEKLEQAKAAEKKAKDALRQWKENPSASPEIMETLRRQAEETAEENAGKKLEQAIEEAKQRENELLQQAEQYREAAKAAEQRAQDARKQAELANPDAAAFRLLFEQVQETWNRLMGTLKKVEAADAKTAGKLRDALEAMVGQWEECLKRAWEEQEDDGGDGE